MSNSSIIEFGAANPRRNLPAHLARKRGESNYVAAFERDYVAERTGTGVGGRYFCIAGYGIADFVWLDAGKYSDVYQDNEIGFHPSITAFELKLRDWKRALHQAYRYSYFADLSVVVLPPEMARIAIKNINLFNKLNIGLWTFDKHVSKFQVIHQPDNSKPRNPAAKVKAVGLFRSKVKFRNLLEQSQSLVQSKLDYASGFRAFC